MAPRKVKWNLKLLLINRARIQFPSGDVYSFGILQQQIVLRNAPYQTPTEVVFNREEYNVRAREIVIEVSVY